MQSAQPFDWADCENCKAFFHFSVKEPLTYLCNTLEIRV
ncbi:MAG: hypothetical protein C4557_06125 [Anaerolineaceae bacterium]|nr:MAG: hypothetical protein C4557_06125 [Anaerolineaceae bacterium]